MAVAAQSKTQPMPTFFLTTSWDDGHPSDVRVAELLHKYEIGGTFYVPCRNSEGRSVLSGADLADVDELFELGAHTYDHKNLKHLSIDEARRQIVDGKACLEDALGHEVKGFCYPQGGYNASIKELARAAGFDYARTIVNFFDVPGPDVFELPTTLQFYPHTQDIYFRNYIKLGDYAHRLMPFLAVLAEGSLVERILRLSQLAEKHRGCLHIWGHSWELDELDLWRELEEALRRVKDVSEEMRTGTNGDFVQSHLQLERA